MNGAEDAKRTEDAKGTEDAEGAEDAEAQSAEAALFLVD
jgi:hypothetical protein